VENAPEIAHLASMLNVILTETSEMLFPVHKSNKHTHSERKADLKGSQVDLQAKA